MANYTVRFLDPTGHSLHDFRLELEDVGGGVDELTALMTTSANNPMDTARFLIDGGMDPRAPYSLEITKEN